MKRGFRSLTSKTLATLMILSAVSPALAQTYNYGKPVSTTKPSSTYSYGQNNYQNQGGYNLPPLQGRVITVPSGSVISGAAPTRTISTKYITPGDPIVLTLNQPYYFAGVEVLPAGTSILGNAVVAQKAGYTGQFGKLKIMFNNATLPNGQRIPVSGKIVTEDGTGLLTGGTTGSRVVSAGKNAAAGAGVGALAGLIGGALGGGKHVGRSTAIMTGIGGGLGLGKSLIDKGNDIVIEAGQPIDIMLDQPLTVGGSQSGSSYYNNRDY